MVKAQAIPRTLRTVSERQINEPEEHCTENENTGDNKPPLRYLRAVGDVGQQEFGEHVKKAVISQRKQDIRKPIKVVVSGSSAVHIEFSEGTHQIVNQIQDHQPVKYVGTGVLPPPLHQVACQNTHSDCGRKREEAGVEIILIHLFILILNSGK